MPSRRSQLTDTKSLGLGDAEVAGRRALRVVGEGIFLTYVLPAAGSVVIGRATDADVRVDDPSISRGHARLHIGDPLRIEDLGSANGTRVGGHLLERGELAEVWPGDVVDLGSIMVIPQSGAPARRRRRLWGHGYFEGRLEEECERAQGTRRRFGIVRVHVDGAPSQQLLLTSVAALLGPADVAALYAPGEYELLVTDDGRTEEVARQLVSTLGAEGAVARVAAARYPEHGRSPEELIAHACSELRGGVEVGPLGSTPIVRDPSMDRVHRLVERVAKGSISVLILGETGVGKEVIAETVHRRSPRADAPFVAIDCGSLGEALLESELFGHEKGAFTGAAQSKRGLLEMAQGGTAFLDEIGELSLGLQAKLLRVLEQKEARRVGAVKPYSLDVRFVAATHRDLESDVTLGRFRRDLFFRLNGVSILIPPLRERPSEIEPLAHRFAAEVSAQLRRDRPPKLSSDVLALMLRYAWPGNIRELRNTIERAVLLCTGDAITLEELPVEKMTSTLMPSAGLEAAGVVSPASVPGEGGAEKLQDELDAVERRRVLEILAQCGGNRTRAARMLGMARGTLLARLERYGIASLRPRKRSRSPREGG